MIPKTAISNLSKKTPNEIRVACGTGCLPPPNPATPGSGSGAAHGQGQVPDVVLVLPGPVTNDLPGGAGDRGLVHVGFVMDAKNNNARRDAATRCATS